MATLGGHRGNFTWALNIYKSTDDPPTLEKHARKMAQYIKAAQADGFAAEEITQGQSYPVDEVNKYMDALPLDDIPEMSEEEVNKQLDQKVDTTSVTRLGTGNEIVYAYGYKCAPDRLKIGMTVAGCVQRVVQQINESTPDLPILRIEIRTDRCQSLERAMHSVLDLRGKRIKGGGCEWFKTTTEEIREIYQFVTRQPAE
jgi:Meiotically up-regulated gene 113